MRYHIDMIKKIGLIVSLVTAIMFLPCSANAWKSGKSENGSSNVFIYHIPDEDEGTGDVSTQNTEVKTTATDTAQNEDNTEQSKDIVSDDVTADTTGENLDEDDDEEAISLDENSNEEPEIEDYQISDMYSDVLQGYASYDEDSDDTISLEDTLDVYQAIKIKTPAKIGSKKYYAGIHTPTSLYSSLNTAEYSIAPVNGTSCAKKNGFSAGTMFNQGIDYAELEQTTGVFSRYESKYFAISTAYAKTVNTTNNNYNDNFYLAPELIINQYFSLKEVLSADIAKNRKKIETILSINPFGNKDSDRLRFELGTSATYDDTNALMKSQFKFSTKFKL